MKLKSITLNNFKGMDNIEFSLDQKNNGHIWNKWCWKIYNS